MGTALQSDNRRSHARYQLHRQVIVRVRRRRLVAWTVDVSHGGLKLKMEELPRLDETIEVEMAGPESSVMITPARVCHVRRHSDGQHLVGATWIPTDSRTFFDRSG